MQAEQEKTARDGWATVNGLKLHYLEWGDPSSPVLLLLHGNGSSGRSWELAGPHLGAQYRVIAPDQRGFGESDWDPEARYTCEDFKSDALELLNQLGIERFDLIGHSLGGMSALLLASENQHRVKHVVLADSGPRPDAGDTSAAAYNANTTPLTFDSQDAFLSWGMVRYRRSGIDPTRGRVLRRLAEELKPLPEGGFTWKRDMLGMVKSRGRGEPMFGAEPGGTMLANLTVPVMCTHGQFSPSFSKEAVQVFKERQPKLELVEILNAGHDVHRDNVPQFVDVVRRFLSS
jgi:pimeloyl-ACP methyl ester carboxylesterase